MPTKEEQDELCKKCTWKWVIQNGVNGYKVTSRKNGNSIFLPVAGYRDNSDLYYVGSLGGYWSSWMGAGNSVGACGLYFTFGKAYWVGNSVRNYGRSVRPVCP
jgi:hypothetical protein